MNELCTEPGFWLQLLALVIVLLIERWLGRTDKTKAASILDLLGGLFKRKPTGGNNG